MSQLCGQESWCGAINSQRVTRRGWSDTKMQVMMTAMRNVEEHYLVVGVTELWEETLEVELLYLPPPSPFSCPSPSSIKLCRCWSTCFQTFSWVCCYSTRREAEQGSTVTL